MSPVQNPVQDLSLALLLSRRLGPAVSSSLPFTLVSVLLSITSEPPPITKTICLSHTFHPLILQLSQRSFVFHTLSIHWSYRHHKGHLSFTHFSIHQSYSTFPSALQSCQLPSKKKRLSKLCHMFILPEVMMTHAGDSSSDGGVVERTVADKGQIHRLSHCPIPLWSMADLSVFLLQVTATCHT